jgi:phosphoglycerate dehydrogenase-like enzyme
MEPITVAVAPHSYSVEAFERLERAGRIPAGTRLVVLGDDGRAGADARDASVLWCRRPGPWGSFLDAALETLPGLRWLHTDTVGVNHLPLAELAGRGITLTNGAGNFARPMAEWVLLAMLAAAKHLPTFVRRSDAGVWEPSPTLRELDGTVALLLGLGATNRIVADLAAPFGVEVRASTRRPRHTVPPGIARMITGEAWRDELPEADWIVLGVPLTDATERMIDDAALGAMKPDAWIINVARGALIDEDALARALDDGRIGGAVLDALVEEPLPSSSPLWGRENVIIVPHHTWSSRQSWERMEGLFASGLSHWAAGEPMQNVIDPETGY